MKQNDYQISIISTVKNGEKFITQYLDSIFNQTYKPIEIVIIDDGSTDKTNKIIENYTNKEIVISLIKTSGIGRAKALNLAVDNSNGNWIANLDIDDLWLPEKLQLQVEALNLYQDTDMVITDSIIYNSQNEFDYSLFNMIKQLHSKKIKLIKKEDFYIRNIVNHSSVLINKESLNSIKNYNEELKMQIDYDLWVRMIQNQFKIIQVKEKLSVKRVHFEQSFESGKRINYLTNAFKLKIRFLKSIKAPIHIYLITILKFIFGLLPKSIRNIIK